MTAPAPEYSATATTAVVPGKTLGVVGLVFSLIGLVAWFVGPLLGLILGGVGKSKSKKAGVANGPATAAIVISIILLVLQVILVFALGGLIASIFGMCASLGDGIHEIHGVTYTCNVP
jgi:hypothetical protein